MHIPKKMRYTQEHEWVKQEGDLLVVGITDFAQSELGDIVYVEVETEGEELDKDETFGTVEAVKATSDLFMPIAGKVVAINEALEDTPELVNESPYEKGWMIKIEPTNPEDFATLLSAEAYHDLVA